MDSLGVIIPTRNSLPWLDGWTKKLAGWLDLADDVVVVDSFSTDGTAEFLRQRLKHPRVRFFNHPPGLYESWNFGIRQLDTEFVYIATIADAITREGLVELVETARKFRSDVVVSRPEFRTAEGAPVNEQFPVHNMVRTLNVTKPRPLTGLEALLFGIFHMNAALTGSCASDLFRTACLQRFPFPTEFGKAGDCVWGLRHVGDVHWAVTPGVFSDFVRHADTISAEAAAKGQFLERGDGIMRATVERLMREGRFTEAELRRAGVFAMLQEISGFMDHKVAFDRYRKQRWPWILNPTAWRSRAARVRHQSKARALLHAGLQGQADAALRAVAA